MSTKKRGSDTRPLLPEEEARDDTETSEGEHGEQGDETTPHGLSDRERKSLWSVYLNMYIDTMMFAIFLPVLPLYIQDVRPPLLSSFLLSSKGVPKSDHPNLQPTKKKKLGSGPFFLGFTISSFNLAALITSPIVGAWATKRRIAEPMILCLLGGTIGSSSPLDLSS